MKRILTIAILLAASLLGSVAYALSLYEKADIIKMARQAISDTGNSFRYYLSEKTVYYDGALTWLVFVDQMPKAGWEHPCKYVYVPAGNPRVDECAVVDSVCPPSDIRIAPIVKINADSDDLVDVKVAEGPETEASGHTYAVILSGGKDINSNSSRYWNDCSFIYKTLTRKYRVPKSNIKVLMSDGTDPADDIHNEVYSLYFSSPLDLDGDGSPDIQYSATKENLRRVLSEFSGKLGDSDHLFVYVIDHGGSEKVNGERQSYICLWGGDKLYPQELDTYLDGIDAGYMSLLFGQCHSGGFVKPLQRDNRIIMSSCGDGAFDYSYACEEIPFDEFVYRWTCGIAGCDEDGKNIQQANYPGDGVPYSKTLRNVFLYASKNDVYNSDAGVVMEIPQISLLENSTAEDLAFDTVPDVCELYITSGEEPTSPKGVFDLPQKYRTPLDSGSILPQYTPRHVYWNSADVWLRRQDDGMTQHIHQDGCLGPDDEKVYIYVKVRNRGVKAYGGKGKFVRLWWARSAMQIKKAVWKGEVHDIDAQIFGGHIGDARIKELLAPGDSVIKKLSKTFENDELDEAREPSFNMCLLASVLNTRDTKQDGIPVADSTLIAKVWGTRQMAQKNLTSIFSNNESSVVLPYSKGEQYNSLRVLLAPADSAVFNDMNVYLNVSGGSVSEWTPYVKGEIVGKSVNPSLTLNRVQLSDGYVLGNIKMTGSEVCTISLSADQIAQADISEPRDYTVNIELYNAKTHATLGGQSFLIRKKPRRGISFDITSSLDGKGRYELCIENPSESLTYVWKDKDGNLVGTGQNLVVPANLKSDKYTVEARAVSDGAVNYRDVNVARVPKIYDVRIMPGATIAVDFSSPTGSSTSLRLVSSSAGQSYGEYPVDEGVSSVTVPCGRLPKGVASVCLVENGVVTENVKFVR